MQFRTAPAVAATLFLSAPALAATEAEVDRLIALIGLPEVMQIMAEEGIDYGEDLRDELLGGASSGRWDQAVQVLYDPAAMMASFRPVFAEMLAETEAAPLLEFFESDLGQRIITLEVEARRAMQDEDIEAVAGETLAMMRDEDDPRLALLERFVTLNELVEYNVVGAMNANYAFMSGLGEGGAFGGGLTEDQILADVWSQEQEIRLDTSEWVYSYLALAYRPLEDAELERYIALSGTAPGADLNRALFGAFDGMYRAISRGLGQAAAGILAGQDI
jgi:hypothetical protein